MLRFRYLNPRTFPEKNDCVVRAISAVYNLHYALAHAIAALNGRVPRRGANLKAVIDCMNKSSKKPAVLIRARDIARPVSNGPITSANQLYPTLAAIAPLLERGQFIVRVDNHCFAVIDGVQFDLTPNSQRKRVIDIWEIF